MPVVVAKYDGHNVIQRLRDIVGPIDPKAAPDSTIRGKYHIDTLEQAIMEGRAVDNTVHCPDSSESFEIEDHVWSRHYGMRIFLIGSKHVYNRMHPIIDALEKEYYFVAPPSSTTL